MALNESLSVFGINLPVGIVLIDENETVVRCNRQWQSYLDHDAIPVGAQLRDVLPMGYSTLQPHLQRALAGEEIKLDAIQLTVHERKLFWDITLKPQHNDAQQIEGILLLANDVTGHEVSNQLLERRVQDRTRKLQAAFDVMAVATHADEQDLGALLQACLQKVMVATHSSGGAIQLLDESEQWLRLHAHAGLEPEIVVEMNRSSAETGLFGWTASHQETLILPDLTSDWRSSELIRNSDSNVYAGVPMHASGAVVGVLSIFRERKRAFSPEDIAMLTSVADQIGVIIVNHELQTENDRLLLVEERNRLARELHDAVTQSLYSSMLMTGALQKQAENGNLENVRQISAQLQANAQQALKEMRLLIHNLRPSILASVGLARALHHRLNAVEGRASVAHNLQTSGTISLPPDVEEAFYFIAQEALNNSLKHAQASSVTVSLKQLATEVVLSISDDGCGFNPAEVEEGGLGMTSMRERSEYINGVLQINSTINKGTTITIRWSTP